VSTEPETTVDEFERLARTITQDRLRLYGWTAEQIAEAEVPLDHAECAVDGVGRCLDDHPAQQEMNQTAEFVVWLLEHPAAGEVAALSAEVERIESDALAAAERRGYERAARDIAYRIRAELVCCDIYDHDAGTNRAGRTHAICFWGEAGARLAEGVGATGLGEVGGGEFSEAVDAIERRGYERALAHLLDDVTYRRWHSARLMAGHTGEPFVGTRVRTCAARYLADQGGFDA
jgi:hypothetical protein